MDKCDSAVILKQNGLKVTQQRLLLLDAIINTDKIFSALSLQDKVNDNMDLVTIYRILTVFLENKIIRDVISKDTTRFYELSCIHNPVHPHFVCRKCNNIICLNSLKNGYMSKFKEITGDNIVENVIIQFTGICSKCK
ncbi:MAG: transcriptional repressor [Spirochaetes bacterium]|nr:transcriptional repressor [Spirochaetota bacterium]